MGFSEGELYRQVAFPLETGDMVVFYSDGVTEARNAAGALFGADRLMQVINAQNHLAPEPLSGAERENSSLSANHYG